MVCALSAPSTLTVPTGTASVTTLICHRCRAGRGRRWCGAGWRRRGGCGRAHWIHGATDGSNLDVPIRDVGIWVRAPSLTWHTRSCCARAAHGSWSRRTWWVDAVEPQHVRSAVIPERHDEDHPAPQGFAHLLQSSPDAELIRISRLVLLRRAEVGGDGAVGVAVDGRSRRVDLVAVLVVHSPNVHKIPCVGAIRGNELLHDGEWLGGIDWETGSLTKKRLVPKPIGVQIASRTIAETIHATVDVVLTALGACQSARVRCVRSCPRVRLPDIHLGAAGTVPAHGARRVPVQGVGLAIDELDVMGTLRVAVTCSILRASIVASKL